MSGTLYIVATPIGNMQDISLRAIKTLLTSDVIACEDTRRAGLLLQKIREMVPGFPEDKNPRLLSFYDQVEVEKTPEIIELLKQGLCVSLISDAGTPTVSDPGFKLIRECIREDLKVESIPGPSAAIVALTVSGLPTDKFFFVGYPPKKEGHRKEFYESLKSLKGSLKTTIILYEAPHRMIGTLREFREIFGKDMQLVIARELTKVYEEVLRDSVENLQKHFAQKEPKGEFVILFQSEQ